MYFPGEKSITDIMMLSILFCIPVKPEWRTIPTDTTAEIDGSATLWCNAIGVPEVTYEWYYNGNPLPNRRAFSVSGGNLTITSIQSHLSGMYQCVAKNKFGSITAAARLQVTGKFLTVLFTNL